MCFNKNKSLFFKCSNDLSLFLVTLDQFLVCAQSLFLSCNSAPPTVTFNDHDLEMATLTVASAEMGIASAACLPLS